MPNWSNYPRTVEISSPFLNAYNSKPGPRLLLCLFVVMVVVIVVYYRVQLSGPPFSFTTIELFPLCDCNCTSEQVSACNIEFNNTVSASQSVLLEQHRGVGHPASSVSSPGF